MAVWAVSLLSRQLIPPGLTPTLYNDGIRSLTFVGTPVRARERSVLYPRHLYVRLALKLFRREPAITEFDWPFTPTHKSSESFSTLTSSVLHFLLQKLQPAHG